MKKCRPLHLVTNGPASAQLGCAAQLLSFVIPSAAKDLCTSAEADRANCPYAIFSTAIRRLNVSSSAEWRSTQSSSDIAFRHVISGSASGPTGYLSCHIPFFAISSTFAATTFGDTGASARLLANQAAIRARCGYSEGALSTMRRAIAVSMMPGSTNATRTPNVFISHASPSDKASSAHFEAQYAVAGGWQKVPATELMLMIVPLRRSRIDVTTA